MKFKKDKDGNLVLDENKNPIPVDDNGKEIGLSVDEIALDIPSDDDEGEGEEGLLAVAEAIAKKYNVKFNPPTDKPVTLDAVNALVESALEKARTQEKTKMHSRVDAAKKDSDQAKNEVQTMLDGFKNDILPQITEAISGLNQKVTGLEAKIGEGAKSAAEMQVASIREQLLEKAGGKVIEEMVTGETPQELLENFKLAVELYKKYNPGTPDNTAKKPDAKGEPTKDTKSDTDTPEIPVEVPEEYAGVEFEKLPPEIQQSVTKQIADWSEKNPEAAAKLKEAPAEGETTTTPKNTDSSTQKPKTVKYAMPSVINVARQALTGALNTADVDTIPLDMESDAFMKKFGDNREELLRMADQQAMGARV